MFKWFSKDKQKDPKIESSNDTDLPQEELAESADSADLEEEKVLVSSDTLNDVKEEQVQAEKSEEDISGLNSGMEQSATEIEHSLQTDSNTEQSIDQETESPLENAAEPTQESPEIESAEPASKESVSFFARLKMGLSRTKENIGSGFVALLKGKSIDDELYEDLETQLLIADVGMRTTNKIIKQLTEKAKLSQLKNADALGELLKQEMRDILNPVCQPINFETAQDAEGKRQPYVILMVGVNGVGKTTTIGKLAKQFQLQGKKVMLAAGDTFRAAAVEQLQVWGERNNIAVVSQPTGSDSASVIFDAVASAKAKGADVLIADTAGRLQNKDNLIEELKKVVRVMKKQIPEAPHEIMLTLDASTGQNAVSQTKIFNEAVGVTGINLTKLDGTAKGGVIFALADEFAIPVRYIGIGEGIDDLREFNASDFVDALFDDSRSGT